MQPEYSIFYEGDTLRVRIDYTDNDVALNYWIEANSFSMPLDNDMWNELCDFVHDWKEGQSDDG